MLNPSDYLPYAFKQVQTTDGRKFIIIFKDTTKKHIDKFCTQNV